MSNSVPDIARNTHHRFFTRRVRYEIMRYCERHSLPVPEQLKAKIKIDADWHAKFHNKFYRECFAARAQKFSPHHQVKTCARCPFSEICFCRIPSNPEDQEVIELMRLIVREKSNETQIENVFSAPVLIHRFIEYAIAPHL